MSDRQEVIQSIQERLSKLFTIVITHRHESLKRDNEAKKQIKWLRITYEQFKDIAQLKVDIARAQADILDIKKQLVELQTGSGDNEPDRGIATVKALDKMVMDGASAEDLAGQLEFCIDELFGYDWLDKWRDGGKGDLSNYDAAREIRDKIAEHSDTLERLNDWTAADNDWFRHGDAFYIPMRGTYVDFATDSTGQGYMRDKINWLEQPVKPGDMASTKQRDVKKGD
jgi:hypothetical protein